MNTPLPPKPTLPEPRRSSWAAIGLSLVVGSMLLVVLIFLTQGVFLPVLLLGGLVFVVTGLHYLVWGWWLGDYIRRQEALVEEASQAFGDLPFAEAMAQPQRLDDDA